MLVIVDANIVVSVLISSSRKQDLLFSDKVKAVSPDWLLFELGKNWDKICERSKIPKEELDLALSLALSLVREQIKTYSFNEYFDKIPESKNTCPHINDVEYFALALKLGCPIWSGDRKLKRQSRIKVFDMEDLEKELKLESS